MASIRFLCPLCGLKMAVDSANVHMHLTCPKCHQSIRPWGSKLLDIKFACSECGQKIIIDAQAAGFTITCPNCAKSLTVPHDVPAPPQPPSRAPKVEESPIEPAVKQAVAAPAADPAPPANAPASSLLTEDEVAFLAGGPEQGTR